MNSGIDPRTLTRIEVAIILAISIAGHTALAVQVTRTRKLPQPVVQTVSIEIVPPPIEPPKVPPPPEPAPRPRVAPRHVAARPAPRPHFDAPAPVENAPVTEAPLEAPPPVEAPPDPGPAGPPAPAAVAAKPAPIVAAHEGANYLKNPRPAYPELAMRREWEGDVLLRVHVSPEGRALGISIQRSSGREVLDQAAIEAVRNWTFVAARQGGVAVGGWVTVPIVFRLQRGE
jgi:periplasmic protein TonB